MSMPKLPEIPDITCGSALNMILASIAAEELALSRIIEAESEKIEHILKPQCGCTGFYGVKEILAVNQSVTSLLESITHNQIILKNKMDSAINALAEICPPCSPRPPCHMVPQPYPPCPPYPPPCPPAHPLHPPCSPCGFPEKCGDECSAVFRAASQCGQWSPNSNLTWAAEQLPGICAAIDPNDKAKVILLKKGRYEVSFAVNIKARSDCRHSAAVSLQTTENHRREEIFTVYSAAPRGGEPLTISLSGVIVEVTSKNAPLPLSLKLKSPDILTVECGMLSVSET